MSNAKIELSGPQRSHLRGLAHAHKPVVMVGKGGVTDNVVRQVAEALLSHELIKVKLNQPENKQAMASDLAERTGSALCGLLGHTVILYKAHPEKPKIKVPTK